MLSKFPAYRQIEMFALDIITTIDIDLREELVDSFKEDNIHYFSKQKANLHYTFKN
jgi:hypothetical protein